MSEQREFQSNIPAAISPALLLGTYNPKIDEKGRLMLPAKFRAHFSAGVVMTKGQENCIYLLPSYEFAQMYNRIKNAPLGNKSARDYLRMFLSGATDQMPDKQGRITIYPMLRDYAGLKKNVYVIGAGVRAEIWSEDKWQEYVNENESKYAQLSEDVLSLN